MFAVTLLGFALNIFSSYHYVHVSAKILFDMRLALYRHLHSLSPRFWATHKMGDVVSRINNDIAEVQRVSADSLLSVLSNVVFLIGSAVIMASLSVRLFLVSVAAVPVSLWALQHYQKRLAGACARCASAAPTSAASCWRPCSACGWLSPVARRIAKWNDSARATRASWMR